MPEFSDEDSPLVLVPDPRTEKEGICGITEIGSTGIEWVCVKHVHAKIYTRRTPSRTHRVGEPIFDSSPGADAHYFVNRWPNRKAS